VVNLAARLEGMTKEAGAPIIVSQNTYETIKADFECRALGAIPIRGKAQAQLMYEILGLKSQPEKLQKISSNDV
jgi:adenylate cyclase